MSRAIGLHSTVTSPVWAHAAPFAAWLLVMELLGEPAAWKYAVRTVVCLALFVYLRPWRHYPPLGLRHLPLAGGAGLVVFGVWILFETPWAQTRPALSDAYLTVGVMPPWSRTEIVPNTVYAPEVAGWTLTIIRLLGSGLLIACIEEFFWRGFLYRWFISSEFLQVDLAAWNWRYFALVSLLFAVEHQRWLVGLVAGVVFGLVMLRTRDVWATSLCHAVTNLLLGVYVLRYDAYHFWS